MTADSLDQCRMEGEPKSPESEGVKPCEEEDTFKEDCVRKVSTEGDRPGNGKNSIPIGHIQVITTADVLPIQTGE